MVVDQWQLEKLALVTQKADISVLTIRGFPANIHKTLWGAVFSKPEDAVPRTHSGSGADCQHRSDARRCRTCWRRRAQPPSLLKAFRGRRPLRTSIALMFGSMLRSSPVRTAPGPTSMQDDDAGCGQVTDVSASRAPSLESAGTVLPAPRLRSGSRAPASCSRSAWSGSANWTASSSARIRSCAGFIRGQWKGALTGRGTARFAPAALPDRSHAGPRRMARDDDLVGRVEVGRGYTTSPCACLGQYARLMCPREVSAVRPLLLHPAGTAIA